MRYLLDTLRRQPPAFVFPSVALLLVLVPAAEGAKVRYNESTTVATVGPSGVGQTGATVGCSRSGQRVLGGGVLNTAAYADGYVNSTYPVDGPDDSSRPNDAWISYVDATSEFIFGTTVACTGGRAASRLRYRRNEAELVAPDFRKSVTAKCRNGSKVTGGGAYNTGSAGRVALAASRPALRGTAWKVSFRRFFAGPYEIAAYAICTKGRFAKKLRYRSKSGTAPDGTQRGVTVNCPRGSKATGAGLQVNAYEPTVSSVHIITTGKATQASVDARDGAGRDVKFKGYAICHG